MTKAVVRYCLLSYDIPDDSKAHGNPANAMRRQLRRFSVRVNDSDWVLKEGDTPYNLLNQMGCWGMNWWLVRFDNDDVAALAKRVVGAIRKEIREQLQRMKASVQKADADLALILEDLDSMTPKQAAKALALYRGRTSGAVRRMLRLLKDCEDGTAALGFNLHGAPVEASRRIAESLQSSVRTQAAIYALATATLRDGYAKTAAQADQLPMYALADAVEEQGGDAGALRDLIAGDRPGERDVGEVG